MSYVSKQRTIQEGFFSGECGGKFNIKDYPFILREDHRKDNLYEEIVDNAIGYFKDNKIAWWRGSGELPTNHTLSSQVACVNHLFWIIRNSEAATLLLKQIDSEFIAVPFPETGNYVEFEINGCDENHKNYLGESSKTRGANTTSIDAAMLARKGNKTILVFIEWKYVEHYYEKPGVAKTKSNYQVRKNTYKSHLTDEHSPIILDKSNYDDEYEKLSVEPFYQLMRQTLLAWRLTQAKRYGATDYIHVHVIPNGNETLLKGKTSIQITQGSENICEGWKNCLKKPDKYIHIDPQDLVSSAAKVCDEKLYRYLKNRYWR